MITVSSTSCTLSQYIWIQPTSRTLIASWCPPQTLCGVSVSRVTIDITSGSRRPGVRRYGSNMNASPGPQLAV